MTHTPGPWILNETPQAHYWHVEAKFLPVAKVCHEADARLIKSAPDMVDVLRAIEQFIENLDDNIMDKGLALKHVKRVLNDATGE